MRSRGRPGSHELKRGIASLAAIALLIAAAALALKEKSEPMGAPEAGNARFFKGADATLDRYLAQRGCRRAFAAYTRLRLFAPSGNRCVRSGFGRALAYVNAQAIPVAEARADRALDRLVLRDARGRRLYVPFGCRGGTCPQYAADVSSAAWRRRVARRAREVTRLPYAGVFLDDVNFDRNVSDGRGRLATPVRPGRAGTLTPEEWKRSITRLVRAVRAAAPGRELMINTVWWKSESSLDDPVVAEGVRAATDFEVERGTEDTRRGQSFDGLLGVIDRLHGLGLGVTLENYDAIDRRGAEFELATHLLTNQGRDMYAGEWRSCPRPTRGYRPCRQPFWRPYLTRLGRALGGREMRADGLWQRRFRDGLVLLNPPGAPPRGARLDRRYRDLDGATRMSVSLPGDSALVLRR